MYADSERVVNMGKQVKLVKLCRDPRWRPKYLKVVGKGGKVRWVENKERAVLREWWHG